MPLQYSIDLHRLLRQASMTNDRHHSGQLRETARIPRLVGLAADHEVPRSVAGTEVGEAQKGDCLKLAPVTFAVTCGKAPELDHLGLAGLQLGLRF